MSIPSAAKKQTYVPRHPRLLEHLAAGADSDKERSSGDIYKGVKIIHFVLSRKQNHRIISLVVCWHISY